MTPNSSLMGCITGYCGQTLLELTIGDLLEAGEFSI